MEGKNNAMRTLSLISSVNLQELKIEEGRRIEIRRPWVKVFQIQWFSNQASAVSSTIINAKPIINPTVALTSCPLRCDSGMIS